MNYFASAVLSGAAATLATAVGGALAALFSGSRRAVGCVMEFSAGMMIGISVFGLMPEALALGGSLPLFAGLFCGVLQMSAISRGIDRAGRAQSPIYRASVVTACGIAAHNFFEGIACGSGFLVSSAFGVSLVAAISLHNIPEGLSIAVPLRAEGGRHAVALCFLCGIPTAAGALVGACGGVGHPAVAAFSLALAAGTMLTISFADLIPNAKSVGGGYLQALFDLCGVVFGFLLSFV